MNGTAAKKLRQEARAQVAPFRQAVKADAEAIINGFVAHLQRQSLWTRLKFCYALLRI